MWASLFDWITTRRYSKSIEYFIHLVSSKSTIKPFFYIFFSFNTFYDLWGIASFVTILEPVNLLFLFYLLVWNWVCYWVEMVEMKLKTRLRILRWSSWTLIVSILGFRNQNTKPLLGCHQLSSLGSAKTSAPSATLVLRFIIMLIILYF